MRFKVGDWVIDNGNIYRFVEPSSEDSYKKSLETLELWHPKEGEWCWFMFSDKYELRCLTLGKFIGFKADKDLRYTYSDVDGEIFSADVCEPFIGELPTLLKDIR